MQCNDINNKEIATIIKDSLGRIFIDGNQLKCGARISLWYGNALYRMDGRIRYCSNIGYCCFNEEIGDVQLEEGMRALKI